MAGKGYRYGESGSGKYDDRKFVKSRRFCNYCKEYGYIKDKCFKLQGYSDWYKLNNGDKRSVRMVFNVMSNNFFAEMFEDDNFFDENTGFFILNG